MVRSQPLPTSCSRRGLGRTSGGFLAFDDVHSPKRRTQGSGGASPAPPRPRWAAKPGREQWPVGGSDQRARSALPPGTHASLHAALRTPPPPDIDGAGLEFRREPSSAQTAYTSTPRGRQHDDSDATFRVCSQTGLGDVAEIIKAQKG
ncbi:hypothetical protein HPB47_007531 [Ixodes persulcatus]|uniref:Uncharacterized protein n=1 Tax=Ixodes persulcatus TaxID=34615 RepID=A0AC60P7E5_IXOPE|nr:hypothetical protein HPB47_007531 [Ixodes persulcatus]